MLKPLFFWTAFAVTWLLCGCQMQKVQSKTTVTTPANEPTATAMLDAYRRAGDIQAMKYRRYLLNQDIYPRWLTGMQAGAGTKTVAQPSQFWFRYESKTGWQYLLADANRLLQSPGTEPIVVSAETAEIRPLFDHATLAILLAKAVQYGHSARSEPGNKAENNADIYADKKAGNCQNAAPISTPVFNSQQLALSNLRLSANGSAVLFQLCGSHWQFGRFDNQLLRLELSADSAPADWLVSPDKQKAVFIREHNLVLHHFSDGTEQVLTKDGVPFLAYGYEPDAYLRPQGKPEALWSPDSRYLLTALLDEREVLPLPLINFAPTGSIRPKAYSVRTAFPGDKAIPTFSLLTIDTHDGRLHWQPGVTVNAVKMNDSPFSGGRVFWHANKPLAYLVALNRGETQAQLLELEILRGQHRQIFSEQNPLALELSPLLYAPAQLRYLPAQNELLWYSERDGWPHLYLYDLTTGKLKRQLTRGAWSVRELIAIDEPRRQVIVAIAGHQTGLEPYNRAIARVGLDDGHLQLLSQSQSDHQVHYHRDGQLQNLAYSGEDISQISGLSPDGRYLIETRQQAGSANKSYLHDLRSGQSRLWLQAQDLRPAHWRDPAPVQVLAADGKTALFGLLFSPPEVKPGQRYPLIDHIYGGPQVAHVPRSINGQSYLNSASLAELGFYVLVLDGRGTALRGRAFRQFAYGQSENTSYIADHQAAIRQLARQWPIDLHRVGIYGFSGGGYMAANAALRAGDFFKVAVGWSGNHDQRLFWHGWGERYQGLMQNDGSNYQQQANQYYAHQLNARLLLIHGLQDVGVHASQVFQLSQALIEANKDFDLLILPKVGHALPGYPMRRMWDYFVKELAGQRPPLQFELKSSGDYAGKTILDTPAGGTTTR